MRRYIQRAKKAAFEKITIFKALPADIRSSYVNETWRRFNTFKDDQRLKMAIELTADKFFADVLSCGEIKYKENVKRIAALKKEARSIRNKPEMLLLASEK